MSSYFSREEAPPRFSVRSVTLTAVIAFGGTFFLAVVLLPGLADILAALAEPVQFGVVLLLTTGVRVVAGVMGARHLRRRYGTLRRSDAMPSVLLGAGLGWLLFQSLGVLAEVVGGGSVSWLLLPLEGLRWGIEAALGAFVVQPGPVQSIDPQLQRFLIRSKRSR